MSKFVINTLNFHLAANNLALCLCACVHLPLLLLLPSKIWFRAHFLITVLARSNYNLRLRAVSPFFIGSLKCSNLWWLGTSILLLILSLSLLLSICLSLSRSAPLPLYSTGIWGILFFASLQIFHSSEKVKKIAQLITWAVHFKQEIGKSCEIWL